MLDRKNIVSVMISQHRALQKDLTDIVNILETTVEGTGVVELLTKFKSDLVAHLELENNVFYDDLLKEMKAKGQNTTKTELFIAEMAEIADDVEVFLKKYSQVKAIASDVVAFRKELYEIIDTLNLRIESEESGVYSLWTLF